MAFKKGILIVVFSFYFHFLVDQDYIDMGSTNPLRLNLNAYRMQGQKLHCVLEFNFKCFHDESSKITFIMCSRKEKKEKG